MYCIKTVIKKNFSSRDGRTGSSLFGEAPFRSRQGNGRATRRGMERAQRARLSIECNEILRYCASSFLIGNDDTGLLSQFCSRSLRFRVSPLRRAAQCTAIHCAVLGRSRRRIIYIPHGCSNVPITCPTMSLIKPRRTVRIGLATSSDVPFEFKNQTRFTVLKLLLYIRATQ